MPNKKPQLAALVQALEDTQAENIVVLDVCKLTTITDFMVICNGRASRHVKAIANNIIPKMKALGIPVLNISGMDSGDWVLVDLGEFILHIMQPECRSFYNIEGLWQDSIIQNDEISKS